MFKDLNLNIRNLNVFKILDLNIEDLEIFKDPNLNTEDLEIVEEKKEAYNFLKVRNFHKSYRKIGKNIVFGILSKSSYNRFRNIKNNSENTSV